MKYEFGAFSQHSLHCNRVKVPRYFLHEHHDSLLQGFLLKVNYYFAVE